MLSSGPHTPSPHVSDRGQAGHATSSCTFCPAGSVLTAPPSSVVRAGAAHHGERGDGRVRVDVVLAEVPRDVVAGSFGEAARDARLVERGLGADARAEKEADGLVVPACRVGIDRPAGRHVAHDLRNVRPELTTRDRRDHAGGSGSRADGDEVRVAVLLALGVDGLEVGQGIARVAEVPRDLGRRRRPRRVDDERLERDVRARRALRGRGLDAENGRPRDEGHRLVEVRLAGGQRGDGRGQSQGTTDHHDSLAPRTGRMGKLR